MLRQGINVTAKINYVVELGEDNYASLFLSKQGKPNSYDDTELFKEGKIKKEDIVEHVLTVEVTPFGLRIYDHQDNAS